MCNVHVELLWDSGVKPAWPSGHDKHWTLNFASVSNNVVRRKIVEMTWVYNYTLYINWHILRQQTEKLCCILMPREICSEQFHNVNVLITRKKCNGHEQIMKIQRNYNIAPQKAKEKILKTNKRTNEEIRMDNLDSQRTTNKQKMNWILECFLLLFFWLKMSRIFGEPKCGAVGFCFVESIKYTCSQIRLNSVPVTSQLTIISMKNHVICTNFNPILIVAARRRNT